MGSQIRTRLKDFHFYFHCSITNHQISATATCVILQFPHISRPGQTHLYPLLWVSGGSHQGVLLTAAPGLEEAAPRFTEVVGPNFLLTADRRHLTPLVTPQLLEATSISRRQPTVPGSSLVPGGLRGPC